MRGFSWSCTDVASLLLRQTVEHHRARKRSTIVVFGDVIAAFYNVVRSLVTDISPLLQDARLMDDESGMPSALVASLDEHVLNSVTAQLVATWFSNVGSDTVSKFHRGVMPGDPEADQQFTSCHFDAVEHFAYSTCQHVPPDETTLSAERAPPATWNLDVSYVGGIAIPVHADQAINTLRRTVLVLVRVFSTISARALRMALWHTHACNVECVDEHGSTTIRLCCAYKHLSSIVSIQANMLPEVLARTSAANRALGAIRAPVLSAPNIEQSTKNAALSSFVLSRFFHLTPTWPKLNGTWVRKMEGTYDNFARVTSGCDDAPQPSGLPLHTDVQLPWPCHSTAAHATVSFAS